jgi:chaperone modulatory protein CbpM
MNKEQFLATAGAEAHRVEFWFEQRWLILKEAVTGFTDREVGRAHLIRDLENDFGANDEGIDIILHLVDQLHGMRRAFTHLQTYLSDRPHSTDSIVR